jgi:hypothetical protein
MNAKEACNAQAGEKALKGAERPRAQGLHEPLPQELRFCSANFQLSRSPMTAER